MIAFARGLLQVVVLFTFAYGLVSLLEAGKARLRTWWALRQVPRRGLAPQAWVRGPDGKPVPLDQPDISDETDIATEGLGWKVPLGDLVYDRIQVRPPDRTREKHHPLGHRTRSWACLPDAEGQIWEAAIRASRP